MSQRDRARGASESLNQTITEIMKHLDDKAERPKSGLRSFMREKIADLAEVSFQKGFKRGHREAHRRYEEEGAFPAALKMKAKRALAPKHRRKVKLRSTIKKAGVE